MSPSDKLKRLEEGGALRRPASAVPQDEQDALNALDEDDIELIVAMAKKVKRRADKKGLQDGAISSLRHV